MAFFRALIGFIFVAALTAFCVVNRADVVIDVGPMWPPLSVPIYLLALVFLGIGFFFGAGFVWFNSASVRRQKRKQKKTIRALEHEIEGIKRSDPSMQPGADLFPALPVRK